MKTLFIGQNAIHLNTVDSTNSYASELLRQIAPSDGTLVYTFAQTNGRGQRGNTWLGEANKNVALSLILQPSFLRADEQFWLTKAASLATSDVLAETLLNKGIDANISIKWPNDIYVDDLKIAGILIENNLRENHIQNTVMGVGININQTEFPESISATSVKKIAGIDIDKQALLERWCEFMEARYLQLKTNKKQLLDTAYLHRLYRIDEWKNYSEKDVVFEGKITGVTLEGKLRMELRDATIKEFSLKEITFC